LLDLLRHSFTASKKGGPDLNESITLPQTD
jgi:hypothetical protein